MRTLMDRAKFIRNRKTNQKGAAVVETAVMMLVLVPLIFYVFVLSDLTYQILDAQEATISSIWDFSTAPFGAINSSFFGSNGGIDNLNRVEYADHSSAQIDLKNCGKDSKHYRPWVQFTWGTNREYSYSEQTYYNGSSTQVSCARKGDMNIVGGGLDSLGGIVSFSGDKTGGRFVCWSKGELHNFLIPKNVFKEAEDESGQLISSRADSSKGVYGNRGSGWLMLRNRSALVSGAWAGLDDNSHIDIKIKGVHDLIPYTAGVSIFNKEGTFQERSRRYFDVKNGAGVIALTNLAKKEKILKYLNKLKSEKITLLPGIAMVPSPLNFWFASTASHSGKNYKHEDYAFKPDYEKLFWAGDELYTLSHKQYLKTAKEKRGEFYLGAKEVVADIK